MATYKCLLVRDNEEQWLSMHKVYNGEVVVSPVEFSGGQWLLIKRADDGFPCYSLMSQFMAVKQGYNTSNTTA